MNRKLFYVLLFVTNSIVAQNYLNKDSLNVLDRYENVSIDKQKANISYEQRLYRNPFIGLIELSRILHDSTSNYIPLFQGQPIAIYQKNGLWLKTKMLEKSDRQAISFRRNAYKLDWWIEPQYIAKYGNFAQSIQSKINLSLNTQLYLAKGLVITGCVAFPLINDYDTQSLQIRLGTLFLDKFLSLNNSNFLSISTGLFYNDRYGINVQYQKADLNSKWSYGVNMGYTGFYYFPYSNTFAHSNLNDFNVLANLSYRVPRFDMIFKITGGQFLYQDRGFRFDFVRQFSNVNIGFFFVKTTNGGNLGFNFAVPLMSKPIIQKHHVRLRMVDEFRYEYTYSSASYQIGQRFRTGYRLDEKLMQYHHDYWQSQLNLLSKKY